MTPYYEDAWTTIYHGDCREVMTTLTVDVGVVIADPPYGETSLPWDRWPEGWVDVVAASVPNSVPLWCFGSQRMFLERVADFNGWTFAQDLVWEKHNGSGSASDRFRRVHELVLQWYRGPWNLVWRDPVTTYDATARQVRRKERPPHWGEIEASSYSSVDGGPRLARSVQFVRSCHGHAVHPTQKPVGILDPLIRYSAPLSSAVLDPFMGSGSTLVAARSAGRRSIGIEISEADCELAVARLGQHSFDFGGAA